MSCGQPHETDCSEVLAKVYGYLDGELDEESLSGINQHLDECGPCLQEYGLEKAVRSLVLRSCQCQVAPDSLRTSIMTRITAIRSETATRAAGSVAPEQA